MNQSCHPSFICSLDGGNMCLCTTYCLPAVAVHFQDAIQSISPPQIHHIQGALLVSCTR